MTTVKASRKKKPAPKKKTAPRKTPAAGLSRSKKAALREKPVTRKAAAPPLKTAATERRREVIIGALDALKAEDIKTLNVQDICSFADYMIVASGRGARHVTSLANTVVDALEQAGERHVAAEGQETGEWVLIDAGNIVVHIFQPETRTHYNLEKMWSV
ncbi:MAG: ribosome silencing factor [Alphaproteobacteria bacterium]